MTNEETKVMNPEMDETTQANTQTDAADKKKGSSFASRAAATAAGAAVGTGAAVAAGKIYDASVEEPEENQEPQEEEVVVEEPVAQEEHHTSHHTSHHTTHEEPVAATPVETEAKTEDAIPSNGQYIDQPQTQEQPTSPEDDEVHVVGVAVSDNGDGGMATLVGVQVGEDAAMVVDIESDGTVDYIVHDDNENGSIEDNEWHDVSADNLSTANYVEAYVEEAHEQGSMAVVTDLDNGQDYQIVQTEEGYVMTSLEEPAGMPQYEANDDDLYTASNDDMPDYMNDADAGFMEA